MTSRQQLHPPRWAQWLITRLLDENTRYTALGDYEEEYHQISESRGRCLASLHYALKIPGLIPVAVTTSIAWSLAMLKNHIKIATRQLRKERSYSVINIAGLSAGIACFMLILLFIQYEFSFENFNANRELVYHINVEHHRTSGDINRIASTPVPLARTMAEELPEITAFTRYSTTAPMLVAYEDKMFYQQGMVFADPGCVDILGFSLLKQSGSNILGQPYSLVITEDAAEKYFGKADPIGKVMTLNRQMSATVTGVIANHPPNTEFTPEMLISFSTATEIYGQRIEQNWVSNQLQSFILVNPGQDETSLIGKINDVYQRHAPENEVILVMEKLSQLHLFSPVSGNGDIRTVRIFLAVGILILLTACINFMNLSTAKSAMRAKEVGLRKSVGASRPQLIRQFLGESYVYTAISTIVAIGLTCAFLPAIRQITGQALHYSQLFKADILAGLLGLFVIIGLIAGSYPAFFLSTFKPVKTLQGIYTVGSRGSAFRKVLVVSQFCISTALIISTLVLGRQLNYMSSKPLGFQKEQIVILRNRGRIRDITPLKQELLKSSHIQSVCSSWMLPHSIGAYNTITWDGAGADENIFIQQNQVDYDFLETFELELVAGRNFSPEFSTDARDNSNPQNAGAVIINETTARRLGWDDAIGKQVINVFGDRRYHYTVVGVVRDFHFSTMHNAINPLEIFCIPTATTNIAVRFSAQQAEAAIAHIEASWKKVFPDYPVDHYFYDTIFAQRYQSERQLEQLFEYFSFLIIFISCLGLLGLSAYSAERKTKELGVRKVLGASATGLAMLLSREHSKWILLACLLAFPVAFLAMKSWLSTFAYHISLGRQWPLFVAATLLALLISTLTTAYQAIRAATRNPVKSLRHE